LGPLGLSYIEFTLLTATAFMARVFALSILGRLAARIRTGRVLWFGSLGIVPLPMLWLVSDSFAWLTFLQVAGGIAWAMFELASLLAFFEHIPINGRTSVLTVYNLANAIAIALGGAIGATILFVLPEGVAGYFVLLALSSVARFACLPLLRGIQDHPIAEPLPVLRTISVRPSSGGIQRPLIPSLPDMKDDE